jgi:hypothetical protein
MTPKMVDLSLNKYSHIFFKEGKPEPTFYEAMVRNRIQHMKISLNPMINSLNYASNIPELYESILTTWVQLLGKEVLMLTHSQQFGILQATNQQLLSELIPKMEKNIFRIKDLVQVVRIRRYFGDFRQALADTVELQLKEETDDWEEGISALISKSESVV